MKKIFKIVSAIMALTMVFGLAACGGEDPVTNPNGNGGGLISGGGNNTGNGGNNTGNQDTPYVRDFSAGVEVSGVTASWTAFKNVPSSIPEVSEGTTAFAASSAAYANLLVGSVESGVYQNLAAPYSQVENTVAFHEFVYAMNVKSSSDFTLVFFADENSKSTYTSDDITDSVAPKMGVYVTFKSNQIEVKAALGNGTSSKKASADVSATSVSGGVNLDGTTSNDIKISLVRYAEDTVMMQIFINNERIKFEKVSSNYNEDIYGLSLRTAFNGETDGSSIGINEANQDSPYIRLSRGMSASEGLGSGLGVVASNSAVSLSNFKILKMY